MYIFRILTAIIMATIAIAGSARAGTVPPLAFTIDAITAPSTTIQPGQTVSFSTTVTANQAASNYLVTFWWHPVGASTNTGNSAFSETSGAGQPLTATTNWTIPAGTPSGTYTLAVSIYSSNWSVNYASTSTSFTIGAAAAPLAVTINSITAAPAAIQPGNTVTFSTTVTANQNTSNDLVTFWWYPVGASTNTGNSAFTETFTANQANTTSTNWTVPASTPPGTYTLAVSIYSNDWSVNYSSKSITFSVAAASSTNGACGASNGMSLASAPVSLCSAGTASSISGTGPWSWSCAGANGGTTAQCSAAALAVNGACGTANGLAATSAPTVGLCSAGSASSVSGSGPWDWTCSGSTGGTSSSCMAPVYVASVETPGPSAALSAAPPYTCVTNRYVDAVKGNDANPGTSALPWKTIGNASNGWPNIPTAGECVNVLPGTYTINNTIVLSQGGKSNVPTGYVVYRSTVPQAAHVIVASGFNGDIFSLWAPYIVIDGFDIDGNHATTNGHGINGCADGGGPIDIAHHMIAINNIIHDVGGAGLSSCTAEYVTWEHNTIYNTSSTNSYQTSGIDIWMPKALASGSYTPTAADSALFHIVIAYNITYANAEGPTIGGQHTDGNGIIIDTTLGSSTCSTCGTPYPGNILVMGNVSYNNGGGGIHLFFSNNVTVANNTVYNNYLDTLNPGTARGELSSGGSINNTWINNVAYSVPGSGVLANNSPIGNFSLPTFPNSGTWSNNIAFGGPVVNTPSSTVNPATNLIGVNPQLTDPAAGNFIPLASSPAIDAGLPESYIPSPTPDIGAYSPVVASAAVSPAASTSRPPCRITPLPTKLALPRCALTSHASLAAR